MVSQVGLRRLLTDRPLQTNSCICKLQSFVRARIEEHLVCQYDYAPARVFSCKVYLTVTRASEKQLRKKKKIRSRKETESVK